MYNLTSNTCITMTDHPPAAKRRKISGIPYFSLRGEFDEGLYSRQLYVLGHDAMRRITNSHILISGMGGLGVEIAKNIILAGVKSVTLHDEQACQFSDLSSQYYLSKDDVGKNRADSCSAHLGSLNQYVHIYVSTGLLTPDFLKQFKVVVLTTSSLQEQLQVSEITRENNIALIVADTKGLFGQIFCDFGENFTVDDCTGESPLSATVASITKEEDGVVACLDDVKHGFEDGDHVTFSEVQGMIEVNGCEPKEIKVLGPYTFSIGDTRNYSKYARGGIVTQVKMPKNLQYKSLRDSLNNPEFIITDFAKPNHPPQLHLAFQTLHNYISERGKCPEAWDHAQAVDFVALAKKINENNQFKVEEVNENLLEVFAKTSAGNLCPMNAVIGGVAAQEVMKATSGKFHPIHQYFYFDAIECLPEDRTALVKDKCKPANSRYDSQVAVFGRDFQVKLGDMKYFVVGTGAIGCEVLKNFSMMGVGAGSGYLRVADMDLVERSNLNGQFLFRSSNIQQFKSPVAAQAVKRMNPDIKIRAFINKVGTDTEELYNDDFFEDLDGVANALDNVETRMYVNQKCVYYKKPLLESGTLGTKGNIQVILPFLTESYGDSHDPPERSIPDCTLRNFPNSIEHTLSWAREMFDDLFRKPYEDARMFLIDPLFLDKIRQQQQSKNLESLLNVKRVFELGRPTNFIDCVQWARNHFETQFRNQIEQLLHNFPADHLTSSGRLFWSGPKRCPHPLIFSSKNSLHLNYVVAAANLRAKVYGIEKCKYPGEIANWANQVKVPPFSPRQGTVLNAEGEEVVNKDDEDPQYFELVTNQLLHLKQDLRTFHIEPIQFEKDDDSNYHMGFITAASNLRAENYGIPPADKHQSKLIAGKIIPAIATTNSVIAGLACLEFYKVAQGFRTLAPYKNGFINLALPFFGFSEPIAAVRRNFYDVEWTQWDSFEVQGELTLRQFLKYFKTNYKLEIDMLSQGAIFLYASFINDVKRLERMDLPMSQVIENITGKNISPNIRSLNFDLICTDEEGIDVEVPNVRYLLPR